MQKVRRKICVESHFPPPPLSHLSPCPSFLFPLCVAGLLQASGRRRHPSSMDASGQGGVRDGVCGVAGEGHGDGVTRPPRYPLYAVQVLRARGEERDASWAREE